MNCPNCGANYNENDVYCGHCGTKIDGKENKDAKQSEEVVVDNKNVFNSDQDLIDAFIGNNVEKIKHNSFSICTFVFRGIYFMYRKMYLYGFLWLIGVPIAMIFIPGFGIVIPLVSAIVLGIKFRDIYLGFIKERVNEIKRLNPNKKHDELVTICRQQGGTNIIPVIIIGAFDALILFLLILFAYLFINIADNAFNKYFGTKEEDDSEVVFYTEDETVQSGKITYTVPAGFNDAGFGNTDTFAYYKHSTDQDMCSFSISSYGMYDSSIRDRLLSYVPASHETEEEEITINGMSWYSIKDLDGYSKEYYYGAVKNDRFYKFNFTMYTQGDICGPARETVLNSLVIGD